MGTDNQGMKDLVQNRRTQVYADLPICDFGIFIPDYFITIKF